MFTFYIKAKPKAAHASLGSGSESGGGSDGIQLQELGGSAEVRVPRETLAGVQVYRSKLEAEWKDKDSVHITVPTTAHVEAFAIALHQLHMPTPIVGVRSASVLPLIAACKLLGVNAARVQAIRLLATTLSAQSFIPAMNLASSRNDVALQDLLYLWAKRTALGARISPKRQVQDAHLREDAGFDALTCGGSRGWSKSKAPSAFESATTSTSTWVGTGLGVLGWAAD